MSLLFFIDCSNSTAISILFRLRYSNSRHYLLCFCDAIGTMNYVVRFLVSSYPKKTRNIDMFLCCTLLFFGHLSHCAERELDRQQRDMIM